MDPDACLRSEHGVGGFGTERLPEAYSAPFHTPVPTVQDALIPPDFDENKEFDIIILDGRRNFLLDFPSAGQPASWNRKAGPGGVHQWPASRLLKPGGAGPG
ncbi:hypothetical protein [Streptomyces sp. SS8]